MHNVLFVQGGGKNVHDQWDNRLVDSLQRNLGSDYEITYPRMPNEADPNYRTWKAALSREFANLDDDTLLVGHSLGGVILVKALVEEPRQRAFGGVFLIAAPFVGDGGWTSEDMELPSDLGSRLPASMPIYLYHGSNDAEIPFGHVELYARAIPQAFVRRLPGRDHQVNEDLSEVAADIRHLNDRAAPPPRRPFSQR
jgi:predicted alpha/beta hydrolase family esterase